MSTTGRWKGDRLRYEVHAARSTLLIEARSNVGAIAWECTDIQGTFVGEVADGAIVRADEGRFEVRLDGLRSGNQVYDSELRRRIDVRRFPSATVDLGAVSAVRDGRYQATGNLELHGVRRSITGMVEVADRDDGRLVVTGEQEIDLRDFEIPPPTMLMMKIYPEVLVRLVAVLTEAGEES